MRHDRTALESDISQRPEDYPFQTYADDRTLPTMVDVLLRRARQAPKKMAFSYLPDGLNENTPATYEALSLRAKAIGAHLQNLNLKGERALLMLPEGLPFVEAFFGSLFGGTIAVPVPVPDLIRYKRTLPRLLAVARDAEVEAILTTASLRAELLKLQSVMPSLADYRWIVLEEIESSLANDWVNPDLEPQQLAYLQYTSGSTRAPKGVMISHHNLTAHAAQLQACYQMSEASVSISWLPHFHDYALLEAIVLPVYAGARSYLISPRTFIKRPIRWLEAIGRYRATHSQGPNFAYDYCLRRFPAQRRPHLDLSSWRTASVGAEPVRQATLEQFYQTFREFGLQREALAPSYGLAEATLGVSTPWRNRDVDHACLDAEELENGFAVNVEPGTPRSRFVANCGQMLPGVEVAIVDPQTHRRRGEGRVGEIWIRSPGVAMGYWKRPTETSDIFDARVAETREGPFLRSGDLGFLLDGCLYITGRLKDLIIVGGSNHYPQDLEYTAEKAHRAIRQNASAAFALEVQDQSRVGVVVEVKRGTEADRYSEIVSAVMEALGVEHEISLGAVALVPPGTLPKTSSGKIQRQLSRTLFAQQKWVPLYQWTDPRWRGAASTIVQGESVGV